MISRLRKTNISSERVRSPGGEMSSGLSWIPLEASSSSSRRRPPRRRPREPSLHPLQHPWFSSLSICSALSPPRLLGGGQVIKHRLQRLLRPQKEERRSRPPSSSVATVGLEEMKSKVWSRLRQLHASHARLSCTLLMHSSQRSQRRRLGWRKFWKCNNNNTGRSSL